MNIERVNEIRTKEDLAAFIQEISEDLSTAPDEWENPDLGRFLSAMAAWVEAIDFYAKNTGDNEVLTPSWKTFAKMLCAAKTYE
jgi:hypothetical protein